MELRVLKYFLIVAREENITRAANLLHVTQPTLSRQLMQLEEELEVKLFQRGKHSISLTEDGLRLKRRAQEIIALADKTKAEFYGKAEALSGEVAIGCGETQNMSFLSERMRRFRTVHPLVSFQIYSATADDIKDRIEQGLLDIGLLMEPVNISKYEFIRMEKKERWGVLVPVNSPLSEKECVTAMDLKEIPLLIPGRQSVQHELSSWFGLNFENIEIAAAYNLIGNAANMVRHQVGTALCFDLDFRYDDLKFIPLSPSIETGAVLVWKKNQMFTNTVHEFVHFLRNTK
ncbi:LysR family transcriptional regulator [Luxibacter massiliensis]|uniref:LysR family transcriptional regulator n=1 Tax=Luxibacter massiliensis TaxID=2219695 RepID=UPI000F046132|nr:LysR family transcriptional regulator [Luxibacter massiliensis]